MINSPSELRKKIDFGGHKEYFTCSLLFKMVMSETRNIHKMLWRTYCCANFFGTILGEDKFNFAETSLTFFGCPAKIFHPAVSGHLRMSAPSMFKYHIRH